MVRKVGEGGERDEVGEGWVRVERVERDRGICIYTPARSSPIGISISIQLALALNQLSIDVCICICFTSNELHNISIFIPRSRGVYLGLKNT